MQTSEATDKIVPALIKAQAEFTSVPKTVQAYNYKYADLDAVWKMVQPVLAKHKLGVSWSFDTHMDEQRLDVVTTLYHESGQFMRNVVTMPLPEKVDPQKIGIATTYGKRYGLSALLAVQTDEDEDAQQAKAEPRQKRAPKKAPPSAPKKADPLDEDRKVMVAALRLAVGDDKAPAAFARATGGKYKTTKDISTPEEMEEARNMVDAYLRSLEGES